MRKNVAVCDQCATEGDMPTPDELPSGWIRSYTVVSSAEEGMREYNFDFCCISCQNTYMATTAANPDPPA